MDVEKRIELVKRNTEEILTEKDLKKLLEDKEKLKHYIGFEISGKIHLGTGLMCMMKIKDFIEVGIDCSVFLADWHTWINNKLGGDMNVIQKIAVGYFKEGMKASMKCVGGDSSKIRFILGSDLYHNNDKYWQTLIDVSKNTTLSRIQRSITIMGRKEEGAIDFATLIYPPMQVADIFIQGLNIAHSGMDQRKAHVIARDIGLKIKQSPLLNKKGEQIKPVAIHHSLILGLGKPPVWPVPKNQLQELWSSLKMSKSKPDTCVFIHDPPEEIQRKIQKAFCPEKEIEFNPLIDWAEKLIFPIKGRLEIKRPEKFGGDIDYDSLSNLKSDFKEGKLHPSDLKVGVAENLIEILAPAREHFSKGEPKKMLEELNKILS